MPYQTEIATPNGAPPRTVLAEEIAEARTRNACLSALSSDALSLLKPYLTEAALHEGSVLWDATKPSSEVYFPTSGLISIVLPVSDGALVEVGSICCQAAVGAIFDRSDTQGVVQIGGRCICMPAKQLFFAAKENSEIENLVSYCRDWILRQAQQMAACNAIHTADERFCRWLFQACERIDTNTISVTQETIASLLGIRRTTVTLIAQKFQTEGLIQYRRGKIAVLDRVQLRAAACKCCNSLARKHWPSTRLLDANAL